jgi:YbgC/YbaW family acyl-CoA thioester hydrolase
MPDTFRTRRRVEFADTDMAGMVHFANFFRYMEAAEVEFLNSLGLSVAMRGEGGERLGLPRVSATCDYQSPARFEDVLDVVVTVKSVGRTSITYGFEFFKGDRPVAKGQITAVCCRITVDRIESVEIPEEIRQKLL